MRHNGTLPRRIRGLGAQVTRFLHFFSEPVLWVIAALVVAAKPKTELKKDTQ